MKFAPTSILEWLLMGIGQALQVWVLKSTWKVNFDALGQLLIMSLLQKVL